MQTILRMRSWNRRLSAWFASGGHSHVVEVTDYGEYRLLGNTLDDAAGEAFDKAARVLSIPYPGGPLLDKLAWQGNPDALQLPRPRLDGQVRSFSFSGLKTALINRVHQLHQAGQDVPAADLAASFRKAVVEQLVGNQRCSPRASITQRHWPLLAALLRTACCVRS